MQQPTAINVCNTSPSGSLPTTTACTPLQCSEPPDGSAPHTSITAGHCISSTAPGLLVGVKVGDRNASKFVISIIQCTALMDIYYPNVNQSYYTILMIQSVTKLRLNLFYGTGQFKNGFRFEKSHYNKWSEKGVTRKNKKKTELSF